MAVDGFALPPSCFSDYAVRLVGGDGCGCDYVRQGAIYIILQMVCVGDICI